MRNLHAVRQNSLQDYRSQSPVGKYFSDAGDSAVRVTRIRKVFPEVGAQTKDTSSIAVSPNIVVVTASIFVARQGAKNAAP